MIFRAHNFFAKPFLERKTQNKLKILREKDECRRIKSLWSRRQRPLNEDGYSTKKIAFYLLSVNREIIFDTYLKEAERVFCGHGHGIAARQPTKMKSKREKRKKKRKWECDIVLTVILWTTTKMKNKSLDINVFLVWIFSCDSAFSLYYPVFRKDYILAMMTYRKRESKFYYLRENVLCFVYICMNALSDLAIP